MCCNHTHYKYFFPCLSCFFPCFPAKTSYRTLLQISSCIQNKTDYYIWIPIMPLSTCMSNFGINQFWQFLFSRQLFSPYFSIICCFGWNSLVHFHISPSLSLMLGSHRVGTYWAAPGITVPVTLWSGVDWGQKVSLDFLAQISPPNPVHTTP